MSTLSHETARKHLERMVPLQEAADATKDSLADAKREARSDGFNIDAVNALLPLLSRYPHDKASGVLEEVIRYAEAYGADTVVRRSDAEVGRVDYSGAMGKSSVGTESDVDAARSRKGGGPRHKALGRSFGTGALRLPTQVAAAVFITFGLIWLLN